MIIKSNKEERYKRNNKNETTEINCKYSEVQITSPEKVYAYKYVNIKY